MSDGRIWGNGGVWGRMRDRSLWSKWRGARNQSGHNIRHMKEELVCCGLLALSRGEELLLLFLAVLHELLEHFGLCSNRFGDNCFKLRDCGVDVCGVCTTSLSGCVIGEGNLGFGYGGFWGGCGEFSGTLPIKNNLLAGG